MRFGTKLENNWSTERKWATLAGRDLTPSQLIAIAHELNYRADYKNKRDAANALGVSVSFVDGFDKALNTISANPALRGGEMLSEMKHGHIAILNDLRVFLFFSMAHYGLQGAVPRMPLMRPSRSALPLFLML